MRRFKLIFFVTEDWYFYSHRLPLAIAAKDAGYDVSVITHVNKHGELIRQAGIRLIPFDLSRRGMNLVSELSVIKRLIKIYREEMPDILHHVAMKPVIYGSFAARFAGVSNVVNAFAGLGYIFTSTDLKARLLRAVMGLSLRWLINRKKSRLILQNQDDSELLIGKGFINKERVRLIKGSGVDINIYSPTKEPDGAPLVILASRMLWAKGIKEFVEAARYLKSRGVIARFALIGDSDMHNPSSISVDQLSDWDSEGVVEWWGHKSDMPNVISKSNIVCLPSFYGEGIPKVLIEAASCGRAIVTTNTPGCKEIVIDGENGLLVPIRNPEKLADAIGTLIANNGLRKKMGENGRKLVENNFSLKIVIEKTMEVYKELLGQ
ncbi:MAG: glycosyltransferase family 4 protein [Desulfatiglans sp.]|nr:glycosyltransferase family 4 protein [Desulfatiglans sp.]